MKYRVEAVPYPNEEQAKDVAQRFPRRYGRDIAVCNAHGKVLYHITQTGQKVK